MLANNETGVVQPVRRGRRGWRTPHGALLHCDAVQAFGKLPFTLAELGADLVSLSAHKLGGPPGVGALVLREGLEPAPLQRGGGQEGRRRAARRTCRASSASRAAVELATDWARRSRSLRDAARAARSRASARTS